MSLLKLKTINYPLLCCCLIGLTGCCCPFQERVVIPPQWHSPLQPGMTMEDPACFHWWEALQDPLLNWLVEEAAQRNYDVHLAAAQSKEKLLETVSLAAAEISKQYIELRSLQEQLQVLEKHIQTQINIFILNEDLSKTGFINTIDQNGNKKNLNSLFVHKSSLEQSIDKSIFHLSALLGYPPGGLYDSLSPPEKQPAFPDEMPVGCPPELVNRHPGIKEAQKEYELSGNGQAFYQYQKKILEVLEEMENALTGLRCESDKIHHLKNNLDLKNEAYFLNLDLYHQGMKNDREVQSALQELLRDENAFIESKKQLLIYYVSLYQALSTGWKIRLQKCSL